MMSLAFLPSASPFHAQPALPIRILPASKPIHCIHSVPTKRSKPLVFMTNDPSKRTNESSSLYKRPSIAIEKGGGFYIPGLEGPKLRLFVSMLAILLLYLNHSNSAALSGSADQVHAAISEMLALGAAISLGGLALNQIVENERLKQRMEKMNRSDGDASGEVQAAQMEMQQSVASSQPLDTMRRSQPVQILGISQTSLDWFTNSVLDLTSADVIFLCNASTNTVVSVQGNAMLVSNISNDVGEVVRRVHKEQQSIYINDIGGLPQGIGLPFLNGTDYAVFVLPVTKEDYTMVVAATLDRKSTSDVEVALTPRDRSWIQACSSALTDLAN